MMINILQFLMDMSFASGAEHGGGQHGPEGVPTVVLYQAINLTIFIGILIWFGKDKVKAIFRQRLTDFNRLAQETEKARQDLEFKKTDLVRRAQLLKSTSEQSLKDAKSDAEKFYQTEIEKAQQAAQKVDRDVAGQIANDQSKLIENLRLEALEMSVANAQQMISTLDSNEKTKVASQVNQRIEGATV